MTICKCIKCKKIFFLRTDMRSTTNVCYDCMREIIRNKQMKREICPICKNSRIDDRTLPSTECNCDLEKELVL